MQIHIGKIIKSIIEEKGLSYVQVGKGINKSNKTVPSYFEKKVLPIDLLIAFSQTLGVDLLSLYYTEEPLKSMRNDEIEKIKGMYQKEIEKNDRLENDLRLTREANEAHKGQIALLNQQLEHCKGSKKADNDSVKSI